MKAEPALDEFFEAFPVDFNNDIQPETESLDDNVDEFFEALPGDFNNDTPEPRIILERCDEGMGKITL